MIVTKAYRNGTQREFKVLSVQDVSGKTAVMITEDNGPVAVSEEDTPDIWAQLIVLGLVS